MPVRTETVLILGEGASADYGFPLGVLLRNTICGIETDGPGKNLLQDLGHSERAIRDFVTELKYSGWGMCGSPMSTYRYWQHFLALEADFAATSRYVEFSQQNFPTYSIEYAKLL